MAKAVTIRRMGCRRTERTQQGNKRKQTTEVLQRRVSWTENLALP